MHAGTGHISRIVLKAALGRLETLFGTDLFHLARDIVLTAAQKEEHKGENGNGTGEDPDDEPEIRGFRGRFILRPETGAGRGFCGKPLQERNRSIGGTAASALHRESRLDSIDIFFETIVSGFENLQIQRIHPIAQRGIFFRVKAGHRKVHEKYDSHVTTAQRTAAIIITNFFIRNLQKITRPSAKPRRKERQIENNN